MALLPGFVLTTLALYFAVAWQAHQHPLEISVWNDCLAIVTVFACAAFCVLLLAGQARVLAWLANLPSTLGLLLTGQPLPQLFVLFQGVLLVWQGLVLFVRLGGARAGLIAAGLIATMPYLLRLESTAMTDVPAAVLAFGSVSAATRWWSDRRPGWLTVFRVLSGSAVSARANTAFVILPALVVVGWGLFRWERDQVAAGLAPCPFVRER